MSEGAHNQQPGLPSAQALHDELRTAENSAAFLLPKLRSMQESNANLTILDVGAGSGTVTATLAKHVSPNGRATGVDIDPKTIPRARAIAQMAGVENVSFQEGDVFKLPFTDGTFDITFCHQILVHLNTPWEALREMLRVTKPGGVVAAREGDYQTECFWPELPGLTKWHEFVAASMNDAGGSWTGGRRLVSWALQAGVRREQITLSFDTWACSSPNERKVWGRLSL